MVRRRGMLVNSKVGRLLAAALIVGFVGSASALDVKVSGDLYNRMNVYTDQATLYAGSETIGSINAPGAVVQRFPIGETWGETKVRLAGTFASDDQNLKGIIGFEWGAIRWGNNPALGCTVAGVTGATCTTGGSVNKNAGGGFSGDGVNVETRFIYVDYKLPMPSLNSRVTVGLQPFTVNKYIWQETATGIQFKGEPSFGYTLAWMRGIEFFNTSRNNAQFADADNLLLRLDLPGKAVPNLKAGAFYLFQHRLPKNATPAAISHLLKNFGAVNYNINNVGLDASYTYGPVFVNLDAIAQMGTIGNTTGDSGSTVKPRRSFDLQAFFAHADVGVNVGPAKVVYTGWYASGDTNRNDKTIRNFIPTDVDMNDSIIFFEGGLTDDNYFTESPGFLDKGAIFNKLAVEVKPVSKLTLGLAGIYAMTAEDLTVGTGAAAKKTKDLGIEVDASATYALMDGLIVAANAGYLFASDGMDFFEAVKNGKKDHDIFRATLALRYRFGGGHAP